MHSARRHGTVRYGARYRSIERPRRSVDEDRRAATGTRDVRRHTRTGLWRSALTGGAELGVQAGRDHWTVPARHDQMRRRFPVDAVLARVEPRARPRMSAWC